MNKFLISNKTTILTILAMLFSVEILAANFPTASGVAGVNTNLGFIDGILLPVARYIAEPFSWLAVVVVIGGVSYTLFGAYVDMQKERKTTGDFLLALLVGVVVITLAIVSALYIQDILKI